MKNSNHYLMASTALLLIGCNSVELGFVPLYAVRPEAMLDATTGLLTCDFDGGETMPFVHIDVGSSSAYSMVVAAENNMQGGVIELQTTGVDETLVIPNQIQPLRFDYRWECDSTGFTAGQEALRLPSFGADRAFCLDKRDETTGNFSGFDIVPATGAAIEPGETGNIFVRIVPPQMMASVRDAFEIAVLADGCCREAGSCQAASMAQPEDNPKCDALQDVFDRVGGDLRANSIDHLTLWRPFVVHTTAATGVPVPYNMRLRGRFEGLTPTGDLVTSTDFVQDVGFCEGCAVPVANACLNR